MRVAALWSVLCVALTFALGSASGHAASAAKKPAAAKSAKPKPPAKAPEPVLEARAIDILKASSARLAAAKSMNFTAVVSYESQSRFGPPLVFTTKSDVTLVRPDKLRVVTFGDGPPSEFYYNGKTMMALAPVENLVAVAEAPPTIDAALEAAFDSAAIYFPFTDLIVADPYKDIAEGLKVAFYIGQSNVIGGTTTDMVAYVTNGVFVQAWIGAEDKLPRRVRAVYLNDPALLRHEMELSNWQLDPAIATEFFESARAAGANRIAFAKPSLPALPALPKTKPSKSSPPKKK
ncbi:MAG: DUF2092 domain-containing protein [Burkholderiales bacterium]|nr:DUF2092 domain-containing protein [Burkholderiales bacterium]